MESFKPEGKHSRSNSQFPLHQSGNLSLSATNLISHSKELVSSCIPTSRVGAQPTLCLSSGPNSLHPINRLATSGRTSPDTACAYQSNENLTEVARLQSQVHELTHKSELLEAELDKTNNQLREPRTTVDVESLKCKAAE